MKSAFCPLYVSVIFFLCSLFLSCKNESSFNVSVSTDTLTIANTDYKLFYFFTDSDDKGFLSFYNSSKRRIEIYDWSTKRPFKSVVLPQVDSINIGSLTDYLILSWDSIVLQHNFKISIIDTASNVLFGHLINDPFSDFFPEILHGNYRFSFPMYFDKSTKLLSLHQYSGKFLSHEQQFYDLPVASGFSFPDKKFSSIRVAWPANYKYNYYGDAIDVSRTVNAHLHVFSFPANDSIYVFNSLDKSIRKFNCRSKFKNEEVRPLDARFHNDINKKVEHLTINPLYRKILYDPFRDLYYRFFVNSVPLRNNDGTYNTTVDKSLSVIVINKNFEVLDEINLPRHEWHYSFVTDKGLCLEIISDSDNLQSPGNKLVSYEVFTFHDNGN